jgi:hypothetical protein
MTKNNPISLDFPRNANIQIKGLKSWETYCKMGHTITRRGEIWPASTSSVVYFFMNSTAFSCGPLSVKHSEAI